MQTRIQALRYDLVQSQDIFKEGAQVMADILAMISDDQVKTALHKNLSDSNQKYSNEINYVL